MAIATRRGVRSMAGAGAPVTVGGQRRHRPDYQIILFTGLLMMFGLVIMYAIGPQRANVLNTAYGANYSGTYFVIKQAISLGLAAAAFAMCAAIPFAFFKKHSGKLIVSGLALCGLLFIGGNILHIDAIAVNTLGAYRWFNLGSFGTFQPSEVMKISLMLFLAGFLGARYQQGRINDKQMTIYPALGLAGLVLFIVVVIQRDLGTGLSIGTMLFSMLIVSSMQWKIIARIAALALVVVVLATVLAPHRMERVATFLNSNSSSAKQDEGYHIHNAMIALGTGGVTGLGVGNSVQATGYLPEAVNDSVFAIIGETFGFIGAVLVLGLFTALLLRLLRTADYLPDMSMRLVAAGVFGWLGAHVVLNVASMISIFPLTGITLPLLSFGGTSMVFIAGALGLVFQLSRYTSHRPIEKEESHENTRSRRGIGGSRYSRRRSYQ